MKILFSPSLVGFFSEDLKDLYEKNGNWPGDLVEITQQVHLEFSGQAPTGKMLGSINGMPQWVDAPAPSHDELVASAESEKLRLKAIADTEITWRQDAVDAGIATDEETSALAEWKKYRILLMRIDTSTAPEITWPQQPQ